MNPKNPKPKMKPKINQMNQMSQISQMSQMSQPKPKPKPKMKQKTKRIHKAPTKEKNFNDAIATVIDMNIFLKKTIRDNWKSMSPKAINEITHLFNKMEIVLKGHNLLEAKRNRLRKNHRLNTNKPEPQNK